MIKLVRWDRVIQLVVKIHLSFTVVMSVMLSLGAFITMDVNVFDVTTWRDTSRLILVVFYIAWWVIGALLFVPDEKKGEMK